MSKITDSIVRAAMDDEYFAPVNGWYMNKNNEIFTQNTMIAKLETIETEERFEQILFIAIEEFKNVPTWSKHKKELARSAMKYALKVVFTNAIDPSGFGIKVIRDEDTIANEIIKAVRLVKYPENVGALVDYENDIVYISCSRAAETCGLIAYYYVENFNQRYIKYFTVVEPDLWDLTFLLDNGINQIYFASLHHPGENTSEYIQLTNNIFNGEIQATYERWRNSKILKFVNGGVK